MERTPGERTAVERCAPTVVLVLKCYGQIYKKKEGHFLGGSPFKASYNLLLYATVKKSIHADGSWMCNSPPLKEIVTDILEKRLSFEHIDEDEN